MGENGFIEEYYKFYNREHLRSQADLSIPLQVEQRVDETLSLIPKDSFSILEIGCGDGRILNRLPPHYGRVCGLDISKARLRRVKTEKVLGSAESLPFPDRSFDLVLCCEVLEHLPFNVYPQALKELERVAAKYVIVSVPNDQDIKRSSVACPHCGCVFHPDRHLRSFNSKAMAELFGLSNNFDMQIFRFCRPVVEEEHQLFPLKLLIKAARLFKITSSSHFPSTALCPQCGYSPLSCGIQHATGGNGKSLIRFVRPWARRLVHKRKRKVQGWLIVLYRRDRVISNQII